MTTPAAADDRKWVLGGGGCIIAGLILSLITENCTWFAVGATTGAAIVGGRLYYRSQAQPAGPIGYRVAERSATATGMPEFLGAPPIDPMDTRPANSPRMLRREEVEGYPMRYRIPECDAFALPMDPRGYSGLVDDIRRVW